MMELARCRNVFLGMAQRVLCFASMLYDSAAILSGSFCGACRGLNVDAWRDHMFMM